jgi:HSP20 family protein
MRLTTCYPQTSILQKFFDDDVFVSDWIPALDIKEAKDQYIIKADLPGLTKEDIKVTLENGILRIEGERKAEASSEDAQSHRIERSYGRFVRAFNFGNEVDPNKVNASYKDGVLVVTVAKREAVQPKSIDINVG